MEIVYFVRPGWGNEELRYSLRSLQNIPHDKVTIVGSMPNWVKGVNFVRGNATKSKQMNVYQNVYLASTHKSVGDEFLMMNDDFFIMQPLETIPTYTRCPLEEHVANLSEGWWKESLQATHSWLSQNTKRAKRKPLQSYELHIPLPTIKDKMAEVLGKAADYQPTNPPQWRTLYGNYWSIPAEPYPHRDAKIRPGGEVDWSVPFLSCSDSTFSQLLPGMRERFPRKSPYEL